MCLDGLDATATTGQTKLPQQVHALHSDGSHVKKLDTHNGGVHDPSRVSAAACLRARQRIIQQGAQRWCPFPLPASSIAWHIRLTEPVSMHLEDNLAARRHRRQQPAGWSAGGPDSGRSRGTPLGSAAALPCLPADRRQGKRHPGGSLHSAHSRTPPRSPAGSPDHTAHIRLRQKLWPDTPLLGVPRWKLHRQAERQESPESPLPGTGSQGSHSGQPSCGRGRGCSGAGWSPGKAAMVAAAAAASVRAPPGGSRLHRGCWRAPRWAGAAGRRGRHLGGIVNESPPSHSKRRAKLKATEEVCALHLQEPSTLSLPFH